MSCSKSHAKYKRICLNPETLLYRIVFPAILFFTILFTGMLTPALAVDSGYLPREAYVAPKYVPPPPPEPKVHMIDNGDGTLTDDHGLTWTRKDSYADLGKCLNWYQSKEYVSILNQNQFAGHSDWRMPSLMDLVGIYDDTREVVMGHDNNPEYTMRTDPLFAKGAAYWYWTSDAEFTKLTDCCAKTFYFVSGMTFIRRFTLCNNGGVRAVRGKTSRE